MIVPTLPSRTSELNGSWGRVAVNIIRMFNCSFVPGAPLHPKGKEDCNRAAAAAPRDDPGAPLIIASWRASGDEPHASRGAPQAGLSPPFPPTSGGSVPGGTPGTNSRIEADRTCIRYG